MATATRAELKTRPLSRPFIVVALLLATLATAAACAPPRDLDLSLNRPTDHQVFRVQIASGMKPIPLSRVHQWSVHLTGKDGKPVSGAVLLINGGMPQHRHGLPTAPRAEAAGTPGDYVIKGMKFSMTGWWVLKLDVRTTDGRADKITFNLVL
jgi:hypothetical protein